MSTRFITLRRTKGAPLTHDQMDDNLDGLNTDLGSVETLLANVKKGATVISNTAPNPTTAYLNWIDTAANPPLLKRRNANNSAWVTLGPALQAPLLRDLGNLTKPADPALALTRLSAHPKYISTIDLTGLATSKYYPVWWTAYSGKYGRQRITISRNNTDDAELDPFGTGNNQLAALLLEIEQTNFQNTLTNPAYLQVINLTQLTRKTVRNIRHAMRCASVLPADGQLSNNVWTQAKASPYISGLYLRGGLTYRVISDQHLALNVSRLDTEVEASASSTFSTKGRWMVKSYDMGDPFLGADYDNFAAPYHAFPYPL